MNSIVAQEYRQFPRHFYGKTGVKQVLHIKGSQRYSKEGNASGEVSKISVTKYCFKKRCGVDPIEIMAVIIYYFILNSNNMLRLVNSSYILTVRELLVVLRPVAPAKVPAEVIQQIVLLVVVEDLEEERSITSCPKQRSFTPATYIINFDRRHKEQWIDSGLSLIAVADDQIDPLLRLGAFTYGPSLLFVGHAIGDWKRTRGISGLLSLKNGRRHSRNEQQPFRFPKYQVYFHNRDFN